MAKPTQTTDSVSARLQRATAQPSTSDAVGPVQPDAYLPALAPIPEDWFRDTETVPTPVTRRRFRFPWVSVTIAALGQVVLALTAGVHLISGTIAALAGIGYFMVSLCFIGAQTVSILDEVTS